MISITRSIEKSYNTIKTILNDPFIKLDPAGKKLRVVLQNALNELKECQVGVEKEKSKDRAISIINNLDREVNAASYLKEKKISAIHTKLNKIQTELTEATLIEPKKAAITPIDIDMELAFLCDIDCPDHNGAIQTLLKKQFLNKVPFVTTRSQLCGAGNTYLNWNITVTDRQTQLEADFIKEGNEWTIYQQQAKNGEGFLVFIPKVSTNDQEAQDLLKAHDFKSDGSLKKISVFEAFVPPEQETSFTSFSELFSESPQKNKLFYVAGHGRIGNPAGLDAAHYEEMLRVLGQQKCLGLAVTSCYAGGKSSLLHIEKTQVEYEAKLKNLISESNHSGQESQEIIQFPVILRSIGDFPTTHEADTDDYFSELTYLIKSGQGETSASLGKAFQKMKGSQSKVDHNLVQIYYPPAADSPAGFRTIGEKSESYFLTFGNLQKEKILQKGTEVPVIVSNKKLIEIHPLTVDATLAFKGKNPILLSMIPGNAHHYIHKVDLAQDSISQFLDENLSFNKQLDVNKGYYIQDLTSPNGEHWQQVALTFSNKGLTCLFYKDGQYFRGEKSLEEKASYKEEPISAWEYAFALEKWQVDTNPEDIAIATQTGGQQGPAFFDKKLTEFKENAALPKPFNAIEISKIEKKIRKLLKETHGSKDENEINVQLVRELLKEMKGTKDRESAIFHLLECGRGDLASVAIPLFDLSANMKNIEGTSLLAAAIISDDNYLAKFLIEKGADINSQDATGNTPLHLAAQGHNSSLIATLLSKGANLEATNKKKETPVFSALLNGGDIKSILALKQAGANMGAIQWGYSLLGSALENKEIKRDIFYHLLDLGLDPNIGVVTPLVLAIRQGDYKTIDKLLEKGAKLELPNTKYYCSPAFTEMMQRCHPSFVKKVLMRPDFPLNPKMGPSPLVAAFSLRKSQYIDILIERGAKFPQYIIQDDKDRIKQGLRRMEIANDYTLLEKLLKQGTSEDFEKIVLTELCMKNPKLTNDLIKRGFFQT